MIFADGLSCVPDFICNCITLFDPVCCDGTTYGNTCEANCGGCTGTITQGACPTTVGCNRRSDCDRGYRCKKDPICRIDDSIRCRDVGKVCVNYNRRGIACYSDKDCDTYNGEICLLANGIGICVDYQSPSTSP